jgi:surfactin synthase thioesterase subunit
MFFRTLVETYGGTASALLDDPDAQAVVLPALRADIAAFECYPRGPKEPIAADIIAVSGQNDRSLSYGDVAAWSGFSRGAAQVLSVPGDHFFVEHEQELLLGELSTMLRSDHLVTDVRPKADCDAGSR